MIQNVNLNTKTNFQGGHNIKVKKGAILREPMSPTGIQATLTGLLADAKNFKPLGNGRISTTAEGIKIHANPDGDVALFTHPQTQEILAYDPEKLNVHLAYGQESDHAAVITPDRETSLPLKNLGETLGIFSLN